MLSATNLTTQKIRNVGPEHVVAVLVELSKHNAIVRRRLGNLKNVYPKHEEFVQKIGKLDASGLAEALKKLSFCAQSKVYLFWKNKTQLKNRI